MCNRCMLQVKSYQIVILKDDEIQYMLIVKYKMHVILLLLFLCVCVCVLHHQFEIYIQAPPCGCDCTRMSLKCEKSTEVNAKWCCRQRQIFSCFSVEFQCDATEEAQSQLTRPSSVFICECGCLSGC